MPTPQAVSRLTAKLDCIQAIGVLALDLTWLNNNLLPVNFSVTGLDKA
jgi:hypothetical protein